MKLKNIFTFFKWVQIIGLVFFFGCANKQTTTSPTAVSNNISLNVLGLSLFGNVIVNNYLQTLVTVTNNTSGPAPVLPVITAPFSVSNIESPCDTGVLPAGQSCNLTIRFAPTTPGSFSTNLTLGSSTVQFTGNGIVGGQINLSSSAISLGNISSGVEYYQNLTLTNAGDVTVAFPTFTASNGGILNNDCKDTNNVLQTCDISLISNFCGSFLSSHSSCQIQFLILETSTGSKNEVINMTSSSSGAGISITPITFSSSVSPGTPSGLVTFGGTQPVLTVDGSGTDNLITTNPIVDEFGNTVIDGTKMTVSVTNLTLDSPTSSFTTTNGVISFNVKPTTNKGNGVINVFGGNAFGSETIYVRAGEPYGTLSLQNYSPNITADGVSQLTVRFNIITDQFNNVVEDGTQIPISILGGGQVYPQIVSTYEGSGTFTVTSSTVAGTATVVTNLNPIFASNSTITGYNATGSFVFKFVAGVPFGTIPVIPAVAAMNAVNDTTIVNIGPVTDSTGNVVASGTTVNLAIQNGVNISSKVAPAILTTNPIGNAQFTLQGTGNRGPIIITASTVQSTGTAQVWAYANTHLTLQGQARDDWGLHNEGVNIINTGRAYTKYSVANDANTSLFPQIKDVWDEVFDYSQLAASDGLYYAMQHVNGNPISTTAGAGLPQGFLIPTPPLSTAQNASQISENPNILSYGETAPLIPYFENSVMYSAGDKFLSTPTWSTTQPSAGSNVSGCFSPDAVVTSHDLYNSIRFDSASDLYECELYPSTTPVTSNLASDRNREDTRSDFYFPMYGYVEDPVGCSFDTSAVPSFSFSLGKFTQSFNNEQTITLFNPNALDLNSFNVVFAQGSDPNWTIISSTCTSPLTAGTNCNVVVSYNAANLSTISTATTFSATLSVQSTAVTAPVSLSVIIDPNAVNQVSTGALGEVFLKSTCFSQLAIFGGYNFIQNGNQVTTSTNTLLSLYNSTGNLINHFDNNCSDISAGNVAGATTAQLATMCAAANGCIWEASAGSTVSNPTYECDNSQNLGSFPAKGKALAPMVQVQRKLYTFSGFDPSGFGQPSQDGLTDYNTDSGQWESVSVDPDPKQPTNNIPQPRYEYAMTYVPETTSLYMLGGITQSTTGTTSNIPLDEIWSLNLSPKAVIASDGTSSIPDLTWNLVCSGCGLPTPYTPIAKNATTPGPGYTTTPNIPYMVWSKPNRKMYIYWQGRSDLAYYFDPTATTISVSPVATTSGASSLAGGAQVVYNEKLGRVFSYNRGNPTLDTNTNINPYFEIWDMDKGNKNYFRAKFNVGAGAKPYASVLTPRVKAYGSSSLDTTCGDPCGGIYVYIYNYDTAQWDEVGDHNAYSPQMLATVGEISNSFVNGAASQHISTTGYVDILVFPKGNPTTYNEMFIDSVFLDGTF
jgi:hypothetical protein